MNGTKFWKRVPEGRGSPLPLSSESESGSASVISTGRGGGLGRDIIVSPGQMQLERKKTFGYVIHQ